MIDKIRQWWFNRKFKQAEFALKVMMANKDSKIYAVVRKYADILARQMCMQWLDNRRVNHCAMCPNTGTLLTLGGKYYCKGHFPKDAKAGIEIVGAR